MGKLSVFGIAVALFLAFVWVVLEPTPLSEIAYGWFIAAGGGTVVAALLAKIRWSE